MYVKFKCVLSTLSTGDLVGDVTGDVTGNVTGTVSSLANHDTDALDEGSSNLYFSNARADARIAAASVGDLSDVDITGIASGNTVVWNGTNFETADHFDGVDFNNELAAKDTDDLSEGSTNQYFTTARARNSVSASGDLSYDANTGVFSFTERTNAEVIALARGALSASNNGTGHGALSYNSTTGNFEFDTVTSANIREVQQQMLAVTVHLHMIQAQVYSHTQVHQQQKLAHTSQQLQQAQALVI